jgi:hypothetical protein
MGDHMLEAEEYGYHPNETDLGRLVGNRRPVEFSALARCRLPAI